MMMTFVLCLIVFFVVEFVSCGCSSGVCAATYSTEALIPVSVCGERITSESNTVFNHMFGFTKTACLCGGVGGDEECSGSCNYYMICPDLVTDCFYPNRKDDDAFFLGGDECRCNTGGNGKMLRGKWSDYTPCNYRPDVSARLEARRIEMFGPPTPQPTKAPTGTTQSGSGLNPSPPPPTGGSGGGGGKGATPGQIFVENMKVGAGQADCNTLKCTLPGAGGKKCKVNNNGNCVCALGSFGEGFMQGTFQSLTRRFGAFGQIAETSQCMWKGPCNETTATTCGKEEAAENPCCAHFYGRDAPRSHVIVGVRDEHATAFSMLLNDPSTVYEAVDFAMTSFSNMDKRILAIPTGFSSEYLCWDPDKEQLLRRRTSAYRVSMISSQSPLLYENLRVLPSFTTVEVVDRVCASIVGDNDVLNAMFGMQCHPLTSHSSAESGVSMQYTAAQEGDAPVDCRLTPLHNVPMQAAANVSVVMVSVAHKFPFETPPPTSWLTIASVCDAETLQELSSEKRVHMELVAVPQSLSDKCSSDYDEVYRAYDDLGELMEAQEKAAKAGGGDASGSDQKNATSDSDLNPVVQLSALLVFLASLIGIVLLCACYLRRRSSNRNRQLPHTTTTTTTALRHHQARSSYATASSSRATRHHQAGGVGDGRMSVAPSAIYETASLPNPIMH